MILKLKISKSQTGNLPKPNQVFKINYKIITKLLQNLSIDLYLFSV